MRALASLLFIGFILVGLSGAFKGTYQPPLLPLKLTIKSNGEVKIEASTTIVTSLGTFGIGAEIPVIKPGDKEHEMLVILRDRNLNPPDTIYRVENDQPLALSTEGAIQMSFDASGIVIVDITNRDGAVLFNYDQATPIINVAAAPASAPAQPIQSPELCGGYTSNLRANSSAIVDFNHNGSLQILTKPVRDARHAIVQAYDNDVMTLLEGPLCRQDIWFWKVYFARKGATGWAGEGLAGDIWMCPDYDPECSIG